MSGTPVENLERGPRVQTEESNRVLVVDDDELFRRILSDILTEAGFEVADAAEARTALKMLEQGQFQAVVSDITMPGMTGLEFLHAVREFDLDLPVLLVTAAPAVETASKAVEFGAFRYIPKPFKPQEVADNVAKAVRLYRLACIKREALRAIGDWQSLAGDWAGLNVAFNRAISELWMEFQPIVSYGGRSIFAFEGLMRTAHPALPHPEALLEAGERLDRLNEIGRRTRALVAAAAEQRHDSWLLFVNLHPRDLLDDDLYDAVSPLSKGAGNVVFEITERASLERITGLRSRVARLRARGFRIAVDDFGAGYAGLTSFACLEPEIVKIDMALIRGIDKDPTRQKLARSVVGMCRDMGIQVVAEGVETVDERNVLLDSGCDLMQGYLFARPAKAFVQPVF